MKDSLSSPPTPNQPPKLYPAQIRFLGVKALHIETLGPANPSISLQDIPINYTTTFSPYNKENHLIQVGIRVEIGSKEMNQTGSSSNHPPESNSSRFPFHLFIELVAEFVVDEVYLPINRVEEWAKINAPYILLPFIREHLFSLTARAGFSPLILPLVEVPTFKIQKAS